MSTKAGGKNRSAARAAVKNGKRIKRKGPKPWMRGQPVMKFGAGGTDKASVRNNGRAPRYSDAPADR